MSDTSTAWSYAGSDASTLTNEDSANDDPKSGTFAKVIGINDDGSMDISLSDGRDMTIKTYNGMPVAVKKQVQSPIKSQVLGSGPTKSQPQGEPNMDDVYDGGPYDPVPAPTKAGWDQHSVPNARQNTSTLTTMWVPNPALPALRQSKGAGGTNETWFDYTARTKTKQTIGQVITDYAKEAGSSKPEDQADFNAMRDKLFKAGLVSGTDQLPNGYSPEFEKAMDDALNSASASGMTLDAYLNQRITNNPNPVGPAGDNTGNQLQVTSKDDIKKQVVDSATKVLGYQPPQSVIDHLTTTYQAQQASAQQAGINAQAKGTGGTSTVVEQPADLATYVEGALRESDPTAAQGNQMGNLFSEFSNLLGGTAPSPTTFGGSN